MFRTAFVRFVGFSLVFVVVFFVGIVVGSFVTDRFGFHPFQAFDGNGVSAEVKRVDQETVVARVVVPVKRAALVVRSVDVVILTAVANRVGVPIPPAAPSVRVATTYTDRVDVVLTRLVPAVPVC